MKLYFSLSTLALVFVTFTALEAQIVTLFGVEESPPPLVEELLTSACMVRLQKIDQSGITRYTHSLPAYSRYDHSLGVYMLLRRYGATPVECIAGLLHDASHTVFSHVGDFLFQSDGKESYQDGIHLWYLKEQKIPEVLVEYGLTLKDIDPKREEFKALERELPDMCADRIEYNLHTGYLFGLLGKEDIDDILNDLKFDGESWYFCHVGPAKRFARLSLYFTCHLWASPENLLTYHWCAEALRQALLAGELTVHDIHFSTDEVVLFRLEQSVNSEVRAAYQRCLSPYESDGAEKLSLHGKFRGIDPLVFREGKLQRLYPGKVKVGCHGKLNICSSINPQKESERVKAVKTTALLFAVIHQKTALTELLLELHADPNVPCEMGLPLEHVKDDVTLASLLISYCADPNKIGISTPLCKAAKGANSKMVETLLQAGALPNLSDKDGLYPLHHMILGQDYNKRHAVKEVCQSLLKAKADVNVIAPGGQTPLHMAVKNVWFDIVNLLLINGADPNIVDNMDARPLDLAVTIGDDYPFTRKSISELLLKHRAEANYKGLGEKTPLWLAVSKNGDEDLVRLLESYGAKLL